MNSSHDDDDDDDVMKIDGTGHEWSKRVEENSLPP